MKSKCTHALFPFALAGAVSALVLASGCITTMVPVSNAELSAERVTISVGDTVRVLTKRGERPTFRVVEVSETALTGDGYAIPYTDMAFVERRRRAVVQSVAAVTLAIASGAVLLESYRYAPGAANVP